MRTVSPAALAAINATSGLEPVIIVQVFWNGIATNYCDRKFAQAGLIGQLLEIGGIEDVVDINGGASSVNLSITLDDVDGSIKNIFNNQDIHKTYVQVLQWFVEIPLSDAFVIFEGEIYSPIVWSEGARTLKFDVVSKITDIEVGFSVEEAAFPFIATSLVGKAWPVVFGTVAGLQPLDLNESPTAVFAEGFSILDEKIWQADIQKQSQAISDIELQADGAWALGIENAYKAGQFKGSIINILGFPDDPVQAAQYDTAASSYFAQANNYRAQAGLMQTELQNLNKLHAEQKSYARTVIPITGSNFPEGIPFVVEFANVWTANAIVVGGNIVLSNIQIKIDVNAVQGLNDYAFSIGADPSAEKRVLPHPLTDQYVRVQAPVRFTWIEGGTEIKIFNLPRYFIVSIGVVNVINVWGKNKYGRNVVPPGSYTIDVQNLGGGLVITRLILPTPLPSLPGFWQEGPLEVDVQSSVGSNTVDIMRWVIARWGTFPVDEASFDYVRTKVDPFPANFALTSRINIVNFLKDVAYQSRCAIWLRDRTYFIKYLPEIVAPVDTITDADVEVNTLTVTSTETERLVTKYVAEWKQRIGQEKPDEIIYRYNINRYGIVEERYNFYIYNQFECVEQAALFWSIRKSNTFKLVSVKCTLNKMRLETFDDVQFAFNEPLVANAPVTGQLTKVSFSPDDDSVTIDAWLPIRFGEMVPYVFAFPDNTQLYFPPLTDPNIRTGNPFAGASGEFIPRAIIPKYVGIKFSFFNPWTQGPGLPADQPPNPQQLVVALQTNALNLSRPVGDAAPFNNFNDKKIYRINDLNTFAFKSTGPNTFYGFVNSQTDSFLYDCTVYATGLDGTPSRLRVRMANLLEGTVLQPGQPLVVFRTIFNVTDSTGQVATKFEYWAQPTTWYVQPVPDDSGP